MSKKIVKVGNIECGAKDLFLISGPCVIEEESIMIKGGRLKIWVSTLLMRLADVSCRED